MKPNINSTLELKEGRDKGRNEWENGEGKSKVSKRQNAKAETLDCLFLENRKICESGNSRLQTTWGGGGGGSQLGLFALAGLIMHMCMLFCHCSQNINQHKQRSLLY